MQTLSIRPKPLFLSLLLSLSMAGSVLAAPEVGPASLALQQAFDKQVTQAMQIVATGDAAKIKAELQLANAKLDAFKASKDVKTLAENKWKLTREMEQKVLLLHLEAATKLLDQKAYSDAIAVLEIARKLEPNMPVAYYLEGLAYLEQDKTWEGTEKLYEAKRLNTYPASRKMENPVKPWEVLMANPVELETKIDAVLTGLGKNTEYPISLNFSTGKHEYLKLVPGVGANLMGRDGEHFDLYLKKDMIKKVLDNMGPSLDIQEKTMRGQVLRFYSYDDYYIIGVNPENAIERIQIDRPGYSVRIQDQSINVGDSSERVKTLLGKEHGFERLAGGDSKFKETWAYNDYGLSFGITADNKIGLVSIWTME